MRWLYSISDFSPETLKYFSLSPSEPSGDGRWFHYPGKNGVISADATMLFHIWDEVYNKSQVNSPDVVVWIKDPRRLSIVAGSGFTISEVDLAFLLPLLGPKPVKHKDDSLTTIIATKGGCARETASGLVAMVRQLQSRSINHLAFRGCTQLLSQAHLRKIAKLVNARKVSAPGLVSELDTLIWPLKRESMEKIRSLYAGERAFGREPNEAYLAPWRGGGAGIFTDSVKGVEAFYQECFRIVKVPKVSEGGLGPFYAMIQRNSSNRFVFPMDPNYSSSLLVVSNEQWVAPAKVPAKKRVGLWKRLRTRMRRRQ